MFARRETSDGDRCCRLQLPQDGKLLESNSESTRLWENNHRRRACVDSSETSTVESKQAIDIRDIWTSFMIYDSHIIFISGLSWPNTDEFFLFFLDDLHKPIVIQFGTMFIYLIDIDLLKQA